MKTELTALLAAAPNKPVKREETNFPDGSYKLVVAWSWTKFYSYFYSVPLDLHYYHINRKCLIHMGRSDKWVNESYCGDDWLHWLKLDAGIPSDHQPDLS